MALTLLNKLQAGGYDGYLTNTAMDGLSAETICADGAMSQLPVLMVTAAEEREHHCCSKRGPVAGVVKPSLPRR